jgi:hypothetical protein
MIIGRIHYSLPYHQNFNYIITLEEFSKIICYCRIKV